MRGERSVVQYVYHVYSVDNVLTVSVGSTPLCRDRGILAQFRLMSVCVCLR